MGDSASLPVNVLVIGAGAYVSGRGVGTHGTVLPALVQAQNRGLVGEIHVSVRSDASLRYVAEQLASLDELLGTHGRVEYHTEMSSRDAGRYATLASTLPAPRCAIVVTPDDVHTIITTAVLQGGAHAMVVKPLAPTVVEVEQLADLADELGLYGAVEFHKRFDESNLLLRRTIEEGALGELCYVEVEYSQRRTIPAKTFEGWAHRTNVFQYLGVHYADIVYFVTAARPRRALATSQSFYLEKHGIATPDAIQALVEWERANGQRFVSLFLTHWIDPECTSAMSNQTITVVGTGGRFEADQKKRGVQMVTEAGGIQDVNPYFTQFYRDADGRMGVHGYGPRSVLQFLSDVAEVESGRTTLEALAAVRPTFRDAVVSTAVVEAVNTSLLSSTWVDIAAAALPETSS